MCYDNILNKRVTFIQSKILHVNPDSNQNIPSNFIQKVPDETYKQSKRNSVFHKVDLSALNLDTIPEYQKTEQEIQEI